VQNGSQDKKAHYSDLVTKKSQVKEFHSSRSEEHIKPMECNEQSCHNQTLQEIFGVSADSKLKLLHSMNKFKDLLMLCLMLLNLLDFETIFSWYFTSVFWALNFSILFLLFEWDWALDPWGFHCFHISFDLMSQNDA